MLQALMSSVCAGSALHGKQVFTYTGSAQTWTVPAGVSKITCKAWSGGGGAGGGNSGSNTSGGGSAAIIGVMTVVPGTVLTINIGRGGQNPTGGWPDGGTGAYSGSDKQGGGGGGATSVLAGAAEWLIVGAGGGGSDGAGTKRNGIPGNANNTSIASIAAPDGGSGANYAGGAAGTTNGTNHTKATAGSASGSGGNGGFNTDTYHNNGGGGGGGWYGGGGGGARESENDCGGGGGGSSYYLNTVFEGGDPRLAGSGSDPGNKDDADRAGAGQGGTTAAQAGTNGRIVFIY